MVVIINRKVLYMITLIFIMIVIVSTVIHGETKATNAKQHGYIALIIDDFGYNGEGTNEILQLGIPITAAVIPFLYSSEKDAEKVHGVGHEVILHVPLESENRRNDLLGPKGITCDLSNDEIKKRVKEGLKQLKWAVGMNNHMGSKATQDRRVMKNVLAVAKENHLFFIDSRTTIHTVVIEIAQQMNVPSLKRDLFIDHVRNPKDIEKQLIKLSDIALENGYAIGIGHVGPAGGKVTVDTIRKMVPILEKKGITFVYVSQLIKDFK